MYLFEFMFVCRDLVLKLPCLSISFTHCLSILVGVSSLLCMLFRECVLLGSSTIQAPLKPIDLGLKTIDLGDIMSLGANVNKSSIEEDYIITSFERHSFSSLLKVLIISRVFSN